MDKKSAGQIHVFLLRDFGKLAEHFLSINKLIYVDGLKANFHHRKT